MTRAFAADPVYRWIHPDDREWAHAGPRFFATLIEHFRRHGTALRTPCGSAILLASDPGAVAAWPQLSLAARLALGLGRRIARGIRVGAALERLRAEEPHHYVAILGTAPEARGRGLASGLLGGAAARSEVQGIPLRLETASEANVSFYARHGFEIADEATVTSAGPRLWALRRSPIAT